MILEIYCLVAHIPFSESVLDFDKLFDGFQSKISLKFEEDVPFIERNESKFVYYFIIYNFSDFSIVLYFQDENNPDEVDEDFKGFILIYSLGDQTQTKNFPFFDNENSCTTIKKEIFTKNILNYCTGFHNYIFNNYKIPRPLYNYGQNYICNPNINKHINNQYFGLRTNIHFSKKFTNNLKNISRIPTDDQRILIENEAMIYLKWNNYYVYTVMAILFNRKEIDLEDFHKEICNIVNSLYIRYHKNTKRLRIFIALEPLIKQPRIIYKYSIRNIQEKYHNSLLLFQLKNFNIEDSINKLRISIVETIHIKLHIISNDLIRLEEIVNFIIDKLEKILELFDSNFLKYLRSYDIDFLNEDLGSYIRNNYFIGHKSEMNNLRKLIDNDSNSKFVISLDENNNYSIEKSIETWDTIIKLLYEHINKFVNELNKD